HRHLGRLDPAGQRINRPIAGPRSGPWHWCSTSSIPTKDSRAAPTTANRSANPTAAPPPVSAAGTPPDPLAAAP
ncbi:MAG: hypothetical protein ACXVYY_10905, partial [Oryzihumus sp.]